ncbi:MAG TPA: Clp protease N-terminal domain-containing protein [Armatimonadota bacterium]|nr:Clp protease N-terminal domain-containing protein [Armatimonadota bacterium]
MERYTQRAKQLLIASKLEAAQNAERYARPEHLLLAMARGDLSVATKVLERMGVPRERLLIALHCQMPSHSEPIDSELAAFDARMERVLSLAAVEARRSNLNYTGTEHLLSGILREGAGTAYRTLVKLGIDIAPFRREVDTYLGGKIQPPRVSKSHRRYEVGKFSDPAEATLWMNSMIARGFKMTFSSTSAGQMWAIFEGWIDAPGDTAAPQSAASADTETPDDLKFRREIEAIISDLAASPETETRGGSTTQDDSEAAVEAES